MKLKNLLKNETNSKAYKQARHRFLAQRGKINCALCPPNKGENTNFRPQKSWKNFREKQFKSKIS